MQEVNSIALCIYIYATCNVFGITIFGQSGKSMTHSGLGDRMRHCKGVRLAEDELRAIAVESPHR